MVSPNDFKFLNEKGNLNELGWDSPSCEKLWRYNLHYFDDLNALDADLRKEWHLNLINKWIIDNVPFVGTSWESYPTSLRIINWIKWHLEGNKLSTFALQSLFIQLRWLNKRLEYHLLGNHLFANAKALVFGGLFFENKEANNWLQKGLAILEGEVKEQILPDGGHFELSTMYHAIALEDILDLINIAKTFEGKLSSEQKLNISSFYSLAQTMKYWLQNMCHPDGEISFFNDSAFNVAPSIAELDSYSKRLRIETLLGPVRNIIFLKDSGYIRIKSGSTVALLDVAKIGPDYLPGHAHADTLTFELSFLQQRLFVNSGISCYGDSSERLRQRGTAAHNTVLLNNKNSSEVWGGFRVARRAYPIGLEINSNVIENTIEVQCAHNGYSTLFCNTIHKRIWRFTTFGFEVIDLLKGKHAEATALFHFHPDIRVEMNDDQSTGSATLPSGKVLDWKILKGRGRLETFSWHPEFGVSIKSVYLTVTMFDGHCHLSINWN
jgi:uncharacterized heparinase superfamily protein